jgi:hypothetical protein
MLFVCLRLLVLGVCAVLVAGCSAGGNMSSGGGTGGGGGGNNATTVTITFEGSSLPDPVAAKIGTGAFAAETLSGNTLTLSIPSGTTNYSVAYLCPAQFTGQSSSQFEYEWEASIVDGTSLTFTCPYPQSVTPTLSGSLNASAIPGVVSFQINAQKGDSFGDGGGGFSGGPTGNFNVPAPAGSNRVLVLANANQGDGPVAAKNFDNQTVPGSLNGGNAVVFGTGDQTTPEPITYNNVPSGFSSPSTYAELGMGGTTLIYSYASDATTQYMALPASATEKGDVYFLDANASSANLPSGVNTEIISPGGPVSFTFPAPWSYTGPTPAALPSFNMGYTGFAGQNNVSQNAWIFWTSGSGGSTATKNIQVDATASYQNGSTTLAIPDLSSVGGFLAPAASGTRVEWDVWIQQLSWGLTSQIPPNGTSNEVSNSGLYTVP